MLAIKALAKALKFSKRTAMSQKRKFKVGNIEIDEDWRGSDIWGRSPKGFFFCFCFLTFSKRPDVTFFSKKT